LATARREAQAAFIAAVSGVSEPALPFSAMDHLRGDATTVGTITRRGAGLAGGLLKQICGPYGKVYKVAQEQWTAA
jgi:fructose-specific phosphotransferase system IIC component